MRSPKGFRSVAIVGGGPSKCLLPINDESIEKWILAISCPEALPYAARAFEMHPRIMDMESVSWSDVEDMDERKKQFDQYIEIMREVKCPVYVPKKLEGFSPNQVEYPIENILRQFGGYFDNSISMMVALALHEGVDQLMFFGCDFHEERLHFAFAKAAVEYYIGLAVGRRIEVLIAPGSSLLLPSTGTIYGYDKLAHEIIPEWKDAFEADVKIRKDIEDASKKAFEAMNVKMGISLPAHETQMNRKQRRELKLA